MLNGLQCGRAVAALMVAVFHANVFLLPKNFYNGEGAGVGFNFGYAGVEFFFVLSGFIMALVHRRDFGQPAQATRFLRKRILRIYPIYWVVLTALLAIYFAAPGRGPEHAREGFAILTSYLLFPTIDGPIMQIAWTLQHEMLFYAVFTLLIVHIRWGMVAFGGWMLACVISLPFWPEMAYPFEFVLKAHNLLFLFGILAALVYKHLSQNMARLSFWAGTLLFLGIGLTETMGGMALSENIRPLGYGLGAALAVIGLAQGNLPAPNWLTFLGNASYAIYLVHLPVMNIAAVPLRKLEVHTMIPPLAMLALITVIVTIAGSLAHIYLEKPLIAFFAKRAAKKSAA
ncbi:acyltransferase [Cognatishimia sp. WU-CL00825]|uniref:acyltransferase family protein n=1 Tax=Cognatishimia sp. WU-CL00825 TaxID=3127658 RepID=UPI003102AECE